MKNKITKCIFALLFLAGLSLLLYPLVSNQWNAYRQSKLISSYEEMVAEQTTAGLIDYSQERTEAISYNEAMEPYILPDSFAMAASLEEPGEEYMSCLNLTGDGMMGYVEIPKINVKLPVYHTTSQDVLEKAAGHLEGSSLPVGGEGTHAVISAHRGLLSAALFTDLDRLEEGDYFFLSILDDRLCYMVDQINVVEPSDTSNLGAEDGKDLVTLMTCTPYGVNSHRLLVRGSRVAYEEIEDMDIAVSAYSGPSVHTNYLMWVMTGLASTAVFIFFLYLYDRRQKRKALTAEGTAAVAPEAGDKLEIYDLEPPEKGAGSRGWQDDWPEGEPKGWRDDWPEEKDEKETD